MVFHRCNRNPKIASTLERPRQESGVRTLDRLTGITWRQPKFQVLLFLTRNQHQRELCWMVSSKEPRGWPTHKPTVSSSFWPTVPLNKHSTQSHPQPPRADKQPGSGPKWPPPPRSAPYAGHRPEPTPAPGAAPPPPGCPWLFELGNASGSSTRSSRYLPPPPHPSRLRCRPRYPNSKRHFRERRGERSGRKHSLCLCVPGVFCAALVGLKTQASSRQYRTRTRTRPQ